MESGAEKMDMENALGGISRLAACLLQSFLTKAKIFKNSIQFFSKACFIKIYLFGTTRKRS